MKKIVTILLSFIMLFSLIPIGTFGAVADSGEVVLSEDFTGGVAGDLFPKGSTSTPGWGALYAAYSGAVSIKFAADPEEETNTAVELIQSTKNIGSTKWYYVGRRFGTGSKALSDGLYTVNFRMRSTDVDGKILQFSVWDTKTSTPIDFNFSNDTVTVYSWDYNGSGGQVISDKTESVTLDHNTWYDVEVALDLRGDTSVKATVSINGETLISGAYLGHNNSSMRNTGVIGEMIWLITNREDASTLDAPTTENPVCASFMVDDIVMQTVGDLEVEVKPTSDGNLKTAEVMFNHNVNAEALLSGISLNNGATASSIEKIDGSQKHYKVTFSEDLIPETSYDMSFTSVSDVYGNPLDGQTVTFKTRDRKFEIGDIKFYSGYGTGAQQEMTALADGTVTAAIDIMNEKFTPVNAALIMLHKRNGAIIDAKVVDAGVPGDTITPKSVELTLSGVTSADSVEAYIWDGIKTMQAHKAAKIIDVNGIESIELASNEIQSAAVNTTILNAGTSTGDMILSGSVVPAVAGTTTAYVLKPGTCLDELTLENFKDIVVYVGQKSTAEDGSYSFVYSFIGAENGYVYNTYIGGKGASEVAEDSIVFYGSDFLEAVVDKVNAATSSEFAQMIREENPIPVHNGVILNDLVKAELIEYYTLEDYDGTENFKSNVSKNLEDVQFTSVEEIRLKLNEEIAKQVENQTAFLELLEDINNTLWDELEQLFKDNDAELNLDWEGSYAELENKNSLKEKLYKKLASETFENFEELRELFCEEAENLINEKTKKSSSGGGGGGVKISSTISTGGNLTPIPQESSEVSKITDFDDLDTVPWAVDAICGLAKADVVSGVGGNSFAPNIKITREQFIKMVVLGFDLYDETAGEETTQFIDMGFNAWYVPYVGSAVKSGIIHGMDETHFGVGKEISRAEMATILNRICNYLGKEVASGEVVEYNDKADIPEYAYEGIMEMTKAGIMSGVGDNNFAPHEKATRAMAAKVIWLLRGER